MTFFERSYEARSCFDGSMSIQLLSSIGMILGIALIIREESYTSELFQGHSGNNLIDPSLQDNVVIGSGIFHYIYHIGCAFNLINNGLVLGGQNSSKRQTVFFLPIDPRDTDHQDPEHIDFSVPRLAKYVHSAWKRHQDAVFWVDINLAIREGLTFYQIDRIQLFFKEHFQLIVFQKLKD